MSRFEGRVIGDKRQGQGCALSAGRPTSARGYVITRVANQRTLYAAVAGGFAAPVERVLPKAPLRGLTDEVRGVDAHDIGPDRHDAAGGEFQAAAVA